VASNAGGPQHAAWYLNLLDDPRVTVQVGRVRAQQRAVDLSAEARARIWSRLIVDSPRYGVYQAGTARVIPLVELVAEA
jgi:deazaflavin-dependent oxidoreductase (nitroreductase family)